MAKLEIKKLMIHVLGARQVKLAWLLALLPAAKIFAQLAPQSTVN
jgi:hypothetical protein